MTRRGLGPTIALAAFALSLTSCDDNDTPPPEARELTRDATGYYCNMIVADHRGPKGQVFLKHRDDPIWFSSARDTIAFTMLPGEPKDIAAIYVNDMARANWDSPEPGTWIEARTAWYVIESSRVGGMGAPEAVPFSNRAAAAAFGTAWGGRVVAFDDIPAGYVVGGANPAAEGAGSAAPDRGEHAH